MLDIFITFLFSVALSTILIFAFKKLFYKLDILDNPKKYWKKRKPIPYSMWVIFFLVFFIVSYIFVEHNYKLYLLWWFGFIITLVSFIDDRLNVSAKIRLLIQIIIWATIWITSIKIGYISNIFGGIIDLQTYNFEILNHTIYIIPLIFTIICKLDRLNFREYFRTFCYFIFYTFSFGTYFIFQRWLWVMN